jgi:hypothetical protein
MKNKTDGGTQLVTKQTHGSDFFYCFFDNEINQVLHHETALKIVTLHEQQKNECKPQKQTSKTLA